VFALQTPWALLAVLAGAVIAMFFTSIAERLRPALLAIDAASLALFCLAGADKALVAGLNGISAILVGAITAVGGGLLRDIVCNREPEIVRRGSLYGVAAIVGSSVYVAMVAGLGLGKPGAIITGGLVALGLRLGALLLGWESPEPVDLSRTIVSAPRQAVSGTAAALRRLSRRRSELSEPPPRHGDPQADAQRPDRPEVKEQRPHEPPDDSTVGSPGADTPPVPPQ